MKLQLSIILSFVILMTIPGAYAENVPDWVKNTAGWWATDAISEMEFVNAIEFLINEEIIKVSGNAVTKSNEGVPDWVKNTAGWWATDAISEMEFVNAIEFLVREGVINIKNTNDSRYPEWLIKNPKWEQARAITGTSFENFSTAFIDKKASQCQNCIETINEHGFRGENFSKIKPENTFRIFAIGGSTTFGDGVNDDESWPAQLQNLFSNVNSKMKIEIINAGIQAGDSSHGYQLAKQKLVNFDPDLLLIYDGWNDTDNNEVDETIKNWEKLCELGKTNNFETIITIQPIIGTGQRQLTDQELNNFFTYTLETMDEEITLKIEKLEELKTSMDSKPNNSCTNIYDLRDIFDYALEPIYWDRGHTNARGNEIIASNMLEILSKFVEFTKTADNSSKYKMVDNIQDIESGVYAPWSDLSFQDFSGMNLKNSVFYSSNLNNANFENADISGVDFRLANIENVDFTNAIIENTRFEFASFNEMDMSKEPFLGMELKTFDLSLANLENVNLYGMNLIFTDLSGQDLSQKNLKNSNLDNTNLSYAQLPTREFLKDEMNNTILTGVDFSDKDLSEILFYSVKIDNANFENTDFTKTIFNTVDFTKIKDRSLEKTMIERTAIIYSDVQMIKFPERIFNANFNNSDFTSSDFSNSRIIATYFGDSILVNTNLENTDMSGIYETITIENRLDLLELSITELKEFITPFPLLQILEVAPRGEDVVIDVLHYNNFRFTDFSNANLRNTDFYFADLSETNFFNADLTNSNLVSAYMKGANLEGANLEGANLEGANLEGANLEGAITDMANLNCINHEICN